VTALLVPRYRREMAGPKAIDRSLEVHASFELGLFARHVQRTVLNHRGKPQQMMDLRRAMKFAILRLMPTPAITAHRTTKEENHQVSPDF
jgi:hypothetical protein